MTWFRLPLFVWAHYATSLIMILGTPVLAITLLLVAAERALHLGIFDPALGGDPVLFQHLFWFYSHPAVYIMILPAMGVISEIVAGLLAQERSSATRSSPSRRWRSRSSASSSGATTCSSPASRSTPGMVFSFLSFLVAIPSAIKVFNWTATLYKGSISFDTPMLYALGFIGLFTIGGLTGLFLAAMGLDIHLHDTYFVVAHFHYIMVGGAVMGYLGGLHYWWPKITGRMYPETLGASSRRCMVFVGFNLTFFPQFIARLPRDAAALSRLPAGVPGAERDVDARARRSWRSATSLPLIYLHLVAASTARRAGAEPVGRDGARVGDPVAAADRELRR